MKIIRRKDESWHQLKARTHYTKAGKIKTVEQKSMTLFCEGHEANPFTHNIQII